MALLFEALSSLVYLIIKPLQLFNLCCQYAVRSFSIVVLTWIELLRAALYLHLIIFWKLLVFALAVFSLPMRACTALYRERMVEMRMVRMRNELEYVWWERKELEGRLNSAVKERRAVEAMLVELEDEHDEAIVKIQQLEGQVHDLKEEIRRLKEVQGKTLWNYRVQADGGNDYNLKNNDTFATSSWKSPNNKNTSQEIVSKYLWEDDYVIKSGPPTILNGADLLARQREIALSRSLFSAILSLLVGVIAWEAENPCMPLVVALFIVVGMSLMSVVRFFSIIDNKTASDAVALLCFNWFILGTLTYPTLPRVARASSPLVSSLATRMFKGLLS